MRLAIAILLVASLLGSAPQTWVNIKDSAIPGGPATGNGSTDDTAAIQAAIDYAYNNGYTGVYCPAGSYKTTNTLWLDPPGTSGGSSWPGAGMRKQTWSGTGYFSSGAFTVSTTTSGSLEAGDYINGTSQAGIQPVLITGGSAPNWTVNASFTQGSSGSPIAGLTGFDPPNPTTFSFSTSFFGDPAAGGNTQGCRIRPTFNNAPAFMAGTGQGMRVSDIQVVSTASGYRGNQPTPGVGIGLTGGNGGSSGNLVENTYVANFYALYKTDANNACCLNDSNTFRKIRGDNGFYGVYINGTQSYINDIVEPELAVNTAVYSPVGKAVNVYGGNLSAGFGQAGSFTISGVSAFSKVADGNGFDYSFTATVASPDSNIPNVYNSYTVATAHFGVIPLTMTAWNSSTNVGTFQIRPPWVFENYGTEDLTTNTDMQAEAAAVTTLYATERLTVAVGLGILLDGVHFENPSSCTTLVYASSGFGGAVSNTIRNPFFNYDPSQAGAALPYLYCQRTFPFIGLASPSTTVLDGGNYGLSSYPVLVEKAINGTPTPLELQGAELSGFRANLVYAENGGYAYSQKGGYGQFESVGRGIGQWDNFYTFPNAAGFINSGIWITDGYFGQFCGFEPCPWVTPNISNYANGGFSAVCPSPSLSGSSYTCSPLGSLKSYPPIPCRTFFALVDWNTGGPAVGGQGTISGTVFTATVAPTSGSYAMGQVLSGPGITGSPTITSLGTGTGGTGTYNISVAQTIASPVVINGTSNSRVRSASCPGWSWGQALTNATTGGTVTWSYKGQSDVLYLDATSLTFMFPGLNVVLPDPTSGNDNYIVTGVFADLGYVTVIAANNNSGAPLAGVKTTIYSCSSSCTIGQNPFVWSAYQ